jgi:hypothetical protein
MVFLKRLEYKKLLLLLIVLTLLWVIYSPHWTFLQLSTQQRQNCSLDHISACQTRNTANRTFLYIIWGRAGFCSELNQLLLAFAYSVVTKRQFLIDSRQWNYGQFTDYFDLPSTNYYPQSNRTFIVDTNRENDRIDHLKTTRTGSQVGKFWIATRGWMQSIQVKRRVAHYLWNSMSKETLKYIQMCKVTNLSDYIGIHIRKGDKLVKEARAIPLNKYIKSIEGILLRNKTIRHIFVASDDHMVIEELRHLKPAWEFFSIHDNNRSRIRTTGHFQSNFNRLSGKDRLFETRLFMCELQMLIDGQYVLCSMSSNVCRLIQILRHQHPSTAISLDRSWYGT